MYDKCANAVHTGSSGVCGELSIVIRLINAPP
jgi:hypothetical protein